MNLDALIDLPEMWRAEVSPDTHWAAWTWAGMDSTIQVYAVLTDGSQPPVRLSSGEQNTYLRSFTPDSKGVIVAQDTGGDERVRLFRIALDQPGNMELLTDPEPNYFILGGEIHGDNLIYGANVDGATGEEIEPTWIYRHNLQTGERIPIAKPERSGGNFTPHLSPNGQYVLYARKNDHPAGSQLWLAAVDGSTDAEILDAGEGLKAFGEWLPDSERVLVLVETPTHFRVGIYSLADRSLHYLIDDTQRNIEDIHIPPGTSEYAVLVETQWARTVCTLLHLESGQLSSLPALSGTFKPLALDKNGEWIGVYYNSTYPIEIVRTGEAFVSLSRVWDRLALTAADLIPADDYRWHSVDNMEIQGWLFRARDEAVGTVVWVHGGPTWHIEDEIIAEVQYYAASGLNVLVPNYRGSTGFSRSYCDAIKVDGWGGREQDDIRTGIEQMIADGIAQKGKVGVTGLSYGGYSSWHAITHISPDLVAAAVPVCGMTDLVVDYETTRPDLRPYSEEMMGGTPQQIPEKYRERSPLYFVENIHGNLMIVQGMRDPNVTPENVTIVEDALRAANIPYEKLTFDDEGHGIERKANKRVMFEQVAAFFKSAFSESNERQN